MTRELSRTYSLIQLLMLSFATGSFFSFMTLAQANGAPAIGFVFWTQAIVVTAFFVYLIYKKQKLNFSRAEVKYFISMSSFNKLVPYAVMAFCSSRVPVNYMSMIFLLIPLMTVGLTSLVKHEPLTRPAIIAIILGLVGSAWGVTSSYGILSAQDVDIVWLFVAFLVPLSFTFGQVFAKKWWPGEMPLAKVTFGVSGVDAIFMGACMLVLEGGYWPGTSSALVIKVLLLYAFFDILSFLLFFNLSKKAGSIFTSQINYLNALTGIGYSVFLFNEDFNWHFVGAFVLVMVGVFITLHQNYKQVKVA